MIRRFELTGDFGTASGEADGPIAPEIAEEVTVAMVRMLDAMCDLQAVNTKVTQKVFRPDCSVYDRKITVPSACWGILY